MSISVVIGGIEYLDITDAMVRLSMDEIASSFEVSFSDKWFSTGMKDLPFVEGSVCDIYANGNKVITGFIDDIPIEYSATSHSIRITGRSLSGLLVDCSAQHKTGSWKDIFPSFVISELIKPYGLTFSYDSSVPIADQNKRLRRFSIEQEETVYDAISRIAKLRGFFIVSDKNGNLVGTRAGKTVLQTRLQKGANIVAASRQGMFQSRYSDYLVKSQNAGDDTWFAENASTKLFYQTSDPQVVLHRPLIIVSDSQGDKSELKLRGDWERNVRAGRSRRVRYTLRGFSQDNGNLWDINKRINVLDPFFDINQEFLITAVSFRYELSGSFSELELTLPQAYDILVPPNEKKKRKWSQW